MMTAMPRPQPSGFEWQKSKESEVKDLKKLLGKMDKVMAEITKGEIKKFDGNALNEYATLQTLIASENVRHGQRGPAAGDLHSQDQFVGQSANEPAAQVGHLCR